MRNFIDTAANTEACEKSENPTRRMLSEFSNLMTSSFDMLTLHITFAQTKLKP